MIFPRSSAAAGGFKSIGAVILLLAIGLACSACGSRSRPAPPSPPPTRPAPSPPKVPPPILPIPDVPDKPEPEKPEPATTPSGPPIRIGLATDAREVRISSKGTFQLIQKAPEAERIEIKGPVNIRVESPGSGKRIFRIQVASLSKSGAAESLARKLEQEFSLPVVIRRPEELQMNQVRIGEFSSRQEANDFARRRLADAGYGDAFVVQESSGGTGGRLLALRGPESLFLLSRPGFIFRPISDRYHLQLGGKPYRGLIDLTLNGNGRITVVNQLGLEDYLRGVVPAELSPSQYPEDAALAAQAIAARTYALKGLGRYRSQGFDLTDDTRTQVYLGVAAEKAATNRIIADTFGQAIYHDGKLIDAMYMSTCGGRTEDFAAVYDAPEVPYLKSVVCAVESENPPAGSDLLGDHHITDVLYSDSGLVVNRDLELAVLWGIAGDAPIMEGQLEVAPDDSEIRAWIDRAASMAEIPEREESSDGIDRASRAGFIQYAVERLFGIQEVERRISRADAAYYVGNLEDGEAIPRPARRAVAYLMQRGLWGPYPNNLMKPDETILRKDALSLVARCIQAIRPETIRTALLLELPGSSGTGSQRNIKLKSGRRSQTLTLADEIRLFHLREEQSIPARRLRVIGNEKVSYHLDKEGRIDFLEVALSATGAASDRFSPVATWNKTLTITEVSKKLSSLAGGVGRIGDIRPARIGKSGRAVQIEVIGSRGSKILNGYRVRGVLELRDTLFTIERSRNPDGTIRSFTFRGRGWGHGVGLCQVGAYGMARAGRSYREILKTYYTDVEIKKAY